MLKLSDDDSDNLWLAQQCSQSSRNRTRYAILALGAVELLEQGSGSMRTFGSRAKRCLEQPCFHIINDDDKDDTNNNINDNNAHTSTNTRTHTRIYTKHKDAEEKRKRETKREKTERKRITPESKNSYLTLRC